MWISYIKRGCLSALIMCSLAGCGDGSSADNTTLSSSDNSGNSTTVTIALSACYQWTPGVKYLNTNGDIHEIVKETFSNQLLIGDQMSNSSGTFTEYVNVDNSYITLPGETIIPSATGSVFNGIYPASITLPAKLLPGQTTSYTNYTYKPSCGCSSTPYSPVAANVSMTFVDFENISLAGKIFNNTCKIRMQNSTDPAGIYRINWVAPGFGVIRSEKQDENGVTISGSNVEIGTILAGG
jgi:hypothetical protein